MTDITVKTLGLPGVKLNGNDLLFPYKKCEALFYYLACEKRISREEACVLLWEDDNEETAKKNLRHALYMIKKVFGCDIIISPIKSGLILNPDIYVNVDIDSLMNEGDISSADGEFLRGFVVKNALNFSQWADTKAEQVKSAYLSALLKKIQDSPISSIDETELLASKYIDTDPYDERVYEAMMLKYDCAGLYHKGIQLYKKLYAILNDEIGIDPNKSIQKIYYSMLNHWSGDSQEKENEKPEGRCREAEFKELEDIYREFLNGKSPFVLISGESGIGKSYMLNEFLQHIVSDDAVVFKAPSFSVEQNNPLQTWNTLLMQLDEYIFENGITIPTHYIHAIARLFPTFGMTLTDDMDFPIQNDIGGNYGYIAAKNCIIRILSLICKTKRMVLVFDDLQYMDDMSLDLLTSLVHSQNSRILIISACHEDMDAHAEQFVSGLIKNRMLKRISLKRFSFDEACIYIREQLDTRTPDEAKLMEIYNNTEGNPFFLAEVTAGYKSGNIDTAISKNTQNVLNDRLNSVSPEARQLIDVISIFRHSVPLDLLIFILNKTESGILHITEDFRYNSLVEEQIENGKVVFSFKHNKMHEFVYSRLSPSKKRILHNRAGYAYENIYTSNLRPYYKRLAYHFRLGENQPKALEYEILELEQNANIVFDLYPVLSSEYDDRASRPDNIESRFDRVEAKLYSLKNSPDIAEIYGKLEARLLRARCRYCILRGNYEEGLKYSSKLMESEYVKSSPKTLVRCIRNMIYYGIQTDDTDMMGEYLDKAFPLLEKTDSHEEKAIIYRLKGLYEIMTGNPQDALPYLDESVRTLEKYELNSSIYALNIAAAYNYMGESYRTRGIYDEAIKHYREAIATCEKNNCLVNPTFYTNMAMAYMQNGYTDKAYELFIAAVSLYDSSTVLMKRSIAKSYSACYYCEKGDFVTAAACLREAKHFSELLGSPSEHAIYEKNLYELKEKYKNKLEALL